jgi:myo-inositol-1(or 4)-monophosphatase
MRGLSDWCVSIGFCLNGKIELGVIYAPDIDTLVWARAGQGAFLGSQKATVSDRDMLDNTVVLLGRSDRVKAFDYPALLNRVFDNGLEYRRNGSAAFSLLTVALGRAEAFYESHLNSWDAMAGILIVQEAGGTVDYPPYADFIRQGGPVFASNAKLHDHIRSVIRGQAVAHA